jgi:hypothetical protein
LTTCNSGSASRENPRFGSLLHVVLATIPLDSDAEEMRTSAQLQGRILGALTEEIKA